MDGSEEYTTECLDFEQRLEDNESLGRRKFCDIKPANKKYEIQELSELCSKEEWNRCKKPQGHDGFLPWQKFLEDAKSSLCQDGINNDSITVDYIKTSGALVVRLVTSYVSGERPEELYPTLFKYRETNYTFTVSGIVIYTERSNERCRCFKCKNLPEKRESTWNVYISTTTHVVFNHKEAISTTAELFYDWETRSTIRKLFVQCVDQRSITGDSCVLKCVTCDETLYQNLTDLLTKQKQLYAALPLCERPTAVIISHPHGMHKHISWGSCQVAYTVQDQMFWKRSYKYKATTCTGSSGAPVFIFETDVNDGIIADSVPVHSGRTKSRGNYSSDFHQHELRKQMSNFKPVCKNSNHRRRNPNQSEKFLSIHLDDQYCEKNHGHKSFFKTTDFDLTALPISYQNETVLQFIKTLSALSCLVKVNYTSSERPEYVPGLLSGRYPLYKKRGNIGLHKGSGIIIEVSKKRYGKCQFSTSPDGDTPSKSGYIVLVKVAAHVVFDESEAHESTITLGFDNNNSRCITLDVCGVVDSDTVGDWSVLHCVTYDAVFAKNLCCSLDQLCNLNRKMCLQYATQSVENQLSTIISHPHGCHKHVSFGKCIDIHETQTSDGKLKRRIFYSTVTCAGSSGAAVYVFGQDIFKFFISPVKMYVHSGGSGEWNISSDPIDEFYFCRSKMPKGAGYINE